MRRGAQDKLEIYDLPLRSDLVFRLAGGCASGPLTVGVIFSEDTFHDIIAALGIMIY